MDRQATIIGAAGFVGRRLQARLVADGWDVFAPARGDPDVFRRELGVMFYCAGLTADYDARPFETVEAHATLVSELIRRTAFSRLIYLSSTRLYDGLPNDPVDEAQPLVIDPTDPRRVYDLSKALGENLALARTGGRGSVARLSNVYDWAGEAPGFLSGWLIQARERRTLELPSTPHVARDYIHLDDVVDALVAMSSSQVSEIVNVASGELVTNGEIAQVFEVAGWTVRFTGDARPLRPPKVRVDRLAALGVKARSVREVVAAYLGELAS